MSTPVNPPHDLTTCPRFRQDRYRKSMPNITRGRKGSTIFLHNSSRFHALTIARIKMFGVRRSVGTQDRRCRPSDGNLVRY